MQPRFEVASVLQAHWPEVQHSAALNSWQLRTPGCGEALPHGFFGRPRGRLYGVRALEYQL
jgi:hypothetical protein